MKILITDGNFKHTLAAIKSLKSHGDEITVCSHIPFSMSFYSTYCDHHLLAPNPESDNTFAQFILDEVQKTKYDVIIPVSYAAVMQLTPIKKEIEKYSALPVPTIWSLSIASNREATMEFVKELGLRIPKTWSVDSFNINDIDFPAVIKGPEGSKFMIYVNTLDEFMDGLRNSPKNSIIQEYIHGDGYGFFALYDKGHVRSWFMHKRLREYPITGGPSTLAESVDDYQLRDFGIKILNNLRWNGVAMIECKKDSKTGEFVLMEINPKLWGSLALSIESGVDFPYMLSRMATQTYFEPPSDYKIGIKYRWVFPGDLFNAITSKSIKRFINDFKDPTIKSDINIHDIIPTLTQIGMTGVELILRLYSNKFWRPHGEPCY